MAAGRELTTTIRLRGTVDRSLDAAFQAAESKAAKIMKSLPKNAGAIMMSVGKAAVAGVTAAAGAATAFAAASVKTGMSFDNAMSQVAATMGKTMDEMRNTVGEVDLAWGHFSGNLDEYAQEMGANTAFSATQAAEALNYMALAGYDAQKSMEMLPNVLNLAAAGAMDLAAASDMVTDASSALGLTTEQTKAMVDQMAQASSKSNTSVAQLGEAILKVGGTAANMKNGTVELSTALGILADNGIKAAEGGTHLRNMMLNLQKARSSNAAAWFEELGIHAYDDTGKLRELGDVFKDLNASIKGMTDQEVDKMLGDVFKLTDLAAARAMLASTKVGLDSVDEQLRYSGVQWENYKDTALAAEGGVSELATQILSGLEGAGKTAAEIQEEIRTQYGMTADDARIAVETMQRALEGGTTRWEELSQSISEAWYTEAGFASSALKAGTSVDEMSKSLEGLGISQEDFLTLVRRSEGDAEKFASAIGEMSGKGMDSVAVFEAMGVSAEEFQEILDKTTGAAQAMADTQLDNLQGDITMIGSAFEGLQITIGKKLTPDLREFVKFGTQGLSRMTSAFKKGGLNAALDEFSKLLSEGLSQIVGELPRAVDAGMSLVKAIGKAILDNADTVIDAADEVVTVFADGILDALPKLPRPAVEILSKLAKAIGRTAPRLIPAAVKAVLDTFLELIRDSDRLVDGAVALLTGLADGITESLPIIAEQAPVIITELVAALIREAPLVTALVGVTIGKEIAGSIMRQAAAQIAGSQSALTLSTALSTVMRGMGAKAAAFLTADIGATVTTGSMAAAGGTIAAALAGSILAAVGGYHLGKEIGKAITGEDELYDSFKLTGENGFFDQVFTGDIRSDMADIVGAVRLWRADVEEAARGWTDDIAEPIGEALRGAFGDPNESWREFLSGFDSLDIAGALAQFSTAATPIGNLIGTVRDLGGAFDFAMDNAGAVGSTLSAEFSEIGQSAENMKTAAATAFGQIKQEAGTSLANAMAGAEARLSGAWAGIQSGFQGMAQSAGSAFGQIVPGVQGAMSGVSSAVQTGLAAAQSSVSTAITAMQTKFGQVLTYLQTTFQSGWNSVWSGAGSIVTAAFDKVKSAVRGAVAKVVSAINALIGGVNTISGAVGIPAIPLISVPQFAEGGTVTSPTLAMVGEAGPETIVPHDNSERSRQLLREAAAGVYGAQASRSPGSSYNITFAPTINGGADPEETAEMVMEKFRSWYEQMKRDDMREAYAQG